VVHPERVLSNSGARPGDKLIFTKAIGTGVISTAIKRGQAESAWTDGAVRSMSTLNKAAAEVITRGASDASQGASGSLDVQEGTRPVPSRSFAVHALTDVTGFGLIGHAREMALGSNVSMSISASRVPLLGGARECVRAGFVPGGLKANREFAECCVEYAPGVPEEVKSLLYDPQTAGGLLISIASGDANPLLIGLMGAGVAAVEIGEVLPKTNPLISVVA
jgi:selenide,water dikinase